MTIYDAGPLAAGPLCGLLNLLSSAANSVSSAKNLVSSLWHTNNGLIATH